MFDLAKGNQETWIAWWFLSTYSDLLRVIKGNWWRIYPTILGHRDTSCIWWKSNGISWVCNQQDDIHGVVPQVPMAKLVDVTSQRCKHHFVGRTMGTLIGEGYLLFVIKHSNEKTCNSMIFQLINLHLFEISQPAMFEYQRWTMACRRPWVSGHFFVFPHAQCFELATCFNGRPEQRETLVSQMPHCDGMQG